MLFKCCAYNKGLSTNLDRYMLGIWGITWAAEFELASTRYDKIQGMLRQPRKFRCSNPYNISAFIHGAPNKDPFQV